MSLMNWTEEYSVGVEEIDEQHKKMFAIINDLFDAMHSTAAEKSLGTFITAMIEYADYHFTTEENYFVGFEYEGKDEHVKSHNAYRDKVAVYVKDFQENKGLLSFEILDFLEDWWIGHVAHVDKMYMELFHARGLR